MSKQIAIVTGAGGGFGAAIVKNLLEVGYHVVATDINQESLDKLSDNLNQHSMLSTHIMDVTDETSVLEVANHIETNISENITVLINNAGVIGKGTCLSEDYSKISKKIIDINLTACFNCVSVFSKYMVKLNYGRIINIASVAGIWGASRGASYAASKAGLIKASESWARELGPYNVCVTAIAPGICKTDMMEQMSEGEQRAGSSVEDRIIKSIVPIGRWGTAEDIAEVVTFLSTCKTNYLNSTVIPIDGGMRVGSL
ncbi:MAG: SDR family NAD(P)-dependent oxidoreductase [Pseudomonadota bacterium]